MEVLDRLGPEHLSAVAVGYRDALRDHQEALNRLNVYPVPDGDTGTNMALTLEAVVAELDGADDMAGVCRAVSHGSLMGARGNSGVILSQMLRGFASRLQGSDSAGAAAVADALADASRAAYEAVMRPVEGTMLTVGRAAADAAAPHRDGTLAEVLGAAAQGARAALERTPEQLAVLAEAGVVDAGGAGLVLLLEVLLNVTTGRPVPRPQVTTGAEAAAGTRPSAGGQDAPEADGRPGGPQYEVMFLLDAADAAVPALKHAWADVGESIVVVGGDGTWNCHIHTDHIGAAVEAGIEAGRPHRIQVTDLFAQVGDRCGEAAAEGIDTDGSSAERRDPSDEALAEAPVLTAVVAVAAGDGLERILRSLGVASVVAGGQSMNPSTADILAAVEAAPGKEVVVLANNKNVVAAATQVVPVATRPVRVVPTANVAEGFAALMAYDADADAEANVHDMGAAAARVVTGEVVQAVRDAQTAAGAANKGDWLGVTSDGIVVVAPDPVEAASALLERLVGEGHEIVTLFEGAPAPPGDTGRITEWLARHSPEVAVEVHTGGQPLAAWLLSVE